MSSRVLGRGSIYTIATAAPAITALGVTPLVTRLLQPDEYGRVALGLVIYQVGATLFTAGLGLSITRHGILGDSRLEGARGLVVFASGLAAILSAASVVSGPWWVPKILDQPWNSSVAVAIAVAGAIAAMSACLAYFRAVERPWEYVLLAAWGSLVGPALGLLAALLIVPSAVAYLSGLLFAYVTCALVGNWLVAREGAPQLRWMDVRGALRLGIPTVPHQLALMLTTGSLIVLCGAVLGVAASGRMQIALLIGTVPGVLTAALNNAWVPVIMRTHAGRRGKATSTSAQDIGWIVACMAGGVAVMSPFLLFALAPPSFDREGLVRVVAIISVSSVLSVAYLSSVNLVFVAGRSMSLAMTTPLSVGLGLGVATLAVRSWELTGVALGHLTTYAALALLTGLTARRLTSDMWSPLVLWAPMAFAVSAALVSAALPVSTVGMIARVVVGLAITVVLGIVTRRAVRR